VKYFRIRRAQASQSHVICHLDPFFHMTGHNILDGDEEFRL